MNARGRLESVKAEIQSIIYELNEISAGLDNQFEGIGSERCAHAVADVADNLSQAKRYLDNVRLAKEESAHNGGGGGSR